MSTHNANQTPLVVVREEIVQAVRNAMVMQCAGQRLLGIRRAFSLLQIVFVNAPVEALLVRALYGRTVSFVQLLWCIEVIAIPEGLAHIGQEEAILAILLQAHGQLASNEDAILVCMCESQLGHCRQVDTLEGATLYFLHLLA